MTLRRTLWALPLAVSVAVLAHVAAFGFLHAPGAGCAPILLGALGIALALALAGTFAGGLRGLPTPPIATDQRFAYAPLLLAAAGAATFALIELGEGHLALGPLLQALVVSIPFAYVVASFARFAERTAYAAGAFCAHFAAGAQRRPAGITLVRGTRRLAYARVLARGTSRGRAPPNSI